MRQRHSPYREDRLGNCGNTALPLDSEDVGQDLTDGRKERVRLLLTEAVTLLCKNSVFYQTELTIEGLLGVTVDTKEVFLVNINQKVNNHSHISSPNQVEDLQVHGSNKNEYDDIESSSRSMHQFTSAWVESNENLSPPHLKRHKKRKTKHQNSPLQISTTLPTVEFESPNSMIDRNTADVQTDVQFDAKASDIVIIKSEPDDEDNDNLDYTENVYEDAGHQTCEKNEEYSIDSNIEQTCGAGDITRSDYYPTGSNHSCKGSPDHLSTNICNLNYPADTTTCDQDGSVTPLGHTDSDRTCEPYITHSAIFPISTTLPPRLGKAEADCELTAFANGQLSIQTATQQSMLFPAGGVDMDYSPASSKGSDTNISNMSMLWNELQQRPNGHPSEDHPTVTNQNDRQTDTGIFTEIQGLADILNSGMVSDGQSVVCKYCGKMLASRTVYSRHLKTHLGRYFTCHICSRRFNRKDNLKRHYALLHQAPGGSTTNTDNELTASQTEAAV